MDPFIDSYLSEFFSIFKESALKEFKGEYLTMYNELIQRVYNWLLRNKSAEDYLEKINRGYFDFIKSYPEQNNLIIDVTDLDFVNSPKDYDSIIDQITAYAVQMQDKDIIG